MPLRANREQCLAGFHQIGAGGLDFDHGASHFRSDFVENLHGLDDADHGVAAGRVLRGRGEYRAGRNTGGDSAVGLLPRVAGVAHPAGEAGRSRGPRIEKGLSLRDCPLIFSVPYR